MARLCLDENFPLPAAEELRRLGHDVLTLQEAGRAGDALPDESVLDLATQQQRAVVTLNKRHFVRLHQIRPDHAGIVVCTFDPDFARQAQRIHALLEAEPQLAAGSSASTGRMRDWGRGSCPLPGGAGCGIPP